MGGGRRERALTYFFGNAQNDKGLCATPGCKGKAIHSFVYKYCDACYTAIANGLEAGLASDLGLLAEAAPLAGAGGLRQRASS